MGRGWEDGREAGDGGIEQCNVGTSLYLLWNEIIYFILVSVSKVDLNFNSFQLHTTF